MAKKSIKYIILGLMVVLIGTFVFGITDKGSLMWGITTAHKSDTVYDIDTEVGGYNPNSEVTFEMMEARYGKGLVDTPNPYYTEEKLFGENCKYIVYGKVLKAENYLMQTETQAYYASHLLTVQVQNSIYGGIRKNKKVNILCRWLYKEDNPDAVEIGENGIFIIHGEPSLLNMDGDMRKLVTIGDIQRFYYYQYCMDSEKEGLNKLKSKQKVIDYWKQEKMINIDLEEE